MNKLPSSPLLDEGIDCDGESHGAHHDAVRDGQVDHKHVGRGPQAFGLEEDIDDQTVTDKVDTPGNHCDYTIMLNIMLIILFIINVAVVIVIMNIIIITIGKSRECQRCEV